MTDENKIEETTPLESIDPMRFYSLSDLVALAKKNQFPIKTKVTLLKLIRNGKLAAVNIGAEDKPVYTIEGSVLKAFLSHYRSRWEIARSKPNEIQKSEQREDVQMVRSESNDVQPYEKEIK